MKRGKDMIKLLLSCLIWIGVAASLALHAESKRVLAEPEYLVDSDSSLKRYIKSESFVFDLLQENREDNPKFAFWFNSLQERQKRGFILFVRSEALSSLLGDKTFFTEKEWLSGRSGETAELTRVFLDKVDMDEIVAAYEGVSKNAIHQSTRFLSENEWLSSFLGVNFADFKKGLFYFFAEHSFTQGDVIARAYQFNSLRPTIETVSRAIVTDKGGNTRISPKSTVSDWQIREIVASSFFTELFYGIPADFMLLISAYETNFSMEYWRGGLGTTQQTMRAANTVLQSDYWINRVLESSGVRIRHQLIPLSALDNVFLCITEAAKTVSIKAAELRVKTKDISPNKRVRFGGQVLPVTWATAYKYNGSKKHAKQYAGAIQHYYTEKKGWLNSFREPRYRLLAFKN